MTLWVFFIHLFQFMAGLSIIVSIHEFGHLFFAKLFGMRATHYMVGFPPKIFKIKIGETEYSLGALLLGGAVKVEGVIDESLDSAHFSEEPQPWEFRAKPAWQRLLFILGGGLFNLVSAVLMYIGLIYASGHTYLPKDEVNKYGIYPSPVAVQMGFQEGDKIIKIDGKPFENFYDIFSPTLFLGNKHYYTIDRGAGHHIDLPISAEMITTLSDEKKAMFLEPLLPTWIEAVVPGSSAACAGLQPGDHIVRLNGQPVAYLHQLILSIKASLGDVVEISYVRNGQENVTTLSIDGDGSPLGIRMQPLAYKTIAYSFCQSIVKGAAQAWEAMQQQCMALWGLVTGKVSVKNALSGPIGIAKIFGDQFILIRFLTLVAALSISIGLANLLPIPALDGGHALFLLYEMVTGRKASNKFLYVAQQVGMVLLFLTILYACGNDICKLLG